jgi:hypothetical protein
VSERQLQPGDVVVRKEANGKETVLVVNADGELDGVRWDLQFDHAYSVARSEVRAGGQVWREYHSEPGMYQPWKA